MTTTAAPTADPKAKTYGGFYRSKGFGVTLGPLHLGPAGSILLLAAAILLLIVYGLFGLLVAAIYAVVAMVPFLLGAWPNRHGRTRLDALSDYRGALRNRQLNGGTMRSGAISNLGSHKLPGVVGSSTLHDFVADDGSQCSFIHYPDAHQFAVSAFCEPDGAFGMDDYSLDNQVEEFGEYLAGTAHQPDLVQIAVTVETAPDGGSPLQREISVQGQPKRASSLSKDVMGSIASSYPGGAPSVETYATFTFNSPKPEKNEDGTKHRAKRDGPEAIGQLLATTLPHLLEALPETGAGVVTPMTSRDVAKVVRQAYNPGDRKIFDQIVARGGEVPQLDWKHCGPSSATHEDWNYYRHGDGVSVVWEMTGLTSGRIRADALLPLLQGHKDTVNMRVTFIYRPMAPEKAALVVEADHKAAASRELNAKRPHARDKKQVDRANVARNAEAEGAALIMWAIIVTATVADPKDVKKAAAAIEHVGPQARLHLRKMHASLAPSFAAGCGVLGVDLEKNLSTIASMTKAKGI